MKITVENDVTQFVLCEINCVYIEFSDGIEAKLDCITDYDIDLDNIDCSIIGLTNTFFNTEIENRFKGKKSNHVILVHIEATGIDKNDGYTRLNVFYDIPCDMKIRRLRINGDRSNFGSMFVELEGFVK